MAQMRKIMLRIKNREYVIPDKFTVARFRFNLSPLEEIHLPLYKGSTLRGGFGHAFKRVVCIQKGKECNGCMVKSTCVYSYVFETSPPEETEILRLYKNVPHPFVIEPPLTSQRLFKKGEEKTLHNHFRVMTAKEISPPNNSPSKIAIEFLTPTRMVFNERIVLEVEFHHMIRTLLRRISSLSLEILTSCIH
jgi:hypothetical protein